MKELLSSSIYDSFTPLSVFNQGKAAQVFNGLSKTNTKYVLRNNMPIGVILSVDKYQELLEKSEKLDEYELEMETSKRLNNLDESKLNSEKNVLDGLGITEEEIEAIPDDEIELDLD